MRRAIAWITVATAALCVAPGSPARAGHCSEIRLLSGVGVVVHTGAVGCAVPEDDVDTDIINPGSTQLLLRVFGEERPASTSRLDFSGVLGGSALTGTAAS